MGLRLCHAKFSVIHEWVRDSLLGGTALDSFEFEAGRVNTQQLHSDGIGANLGPAESSVRPVCEALTKTVRFVKLEKRN